MSRAVTGGWAAAATAAALLIVCASAPAATISTKQFCDGPHGGCSEVVFYIAAPGEANDVTGSTADGSVRVRDAGATITAGRHCTLVGDHEAECVAGFAPLFVETGDGNDRLAGPFEGQALLGEGDDFVDGVGMAAVSGGTGDDVLIHGDEAIDWYGDEGNDRISADASQGVHGGAGDDVLEGGERAQLLDGGPGSDDVHGLGGDDVLAADDRPDFGEGPVSVNADSLDGGPGRDLVTYGFRTVPVTVDLAAGGASGAAGEGDRLTSVEGAVGGSASDVLTGDDGPNVLDGGGGRDTLTGGGGDDAIEGGKGVDRISAGAGDDKIEATGAGPADKGERIDCGDGDDVVASVDNDEPAADCEFARFPAADGFGKFRLHPVDAHPGALTYYVRCPSRLRVKHRCTGKLTLHAGPFDRERRFSVGRSGGPATVERPTADARIRLTLRYRGGYGIRRVFVDVPPVPVPDSSRVAAARAHTPGPGEYWDYRSLLHGPQCKPHHRGGAGMAAWARPRRMTVLTDSVLLGAAPSLRAARPCWRVGTYGRPDLATKDSAREIGKHRVAPLVVIGLGYNSNWERGRKHYAFWARHFDEDANRLLKTLRRRGAKQFIWLNVREPTRRVTPRKWWDQLKDLWYLPYVNERLRRLDRERDDLVVADWKGASKRPGLTYDSLHVKPRGAKLMVRTVRSAITEESRRQARVEAAAR